MINEKIIGWKKDKKAEEYGILFWSKGWFDYVEVGDTWKRRKKEWYVEIVKNLQKLNEKKMMKYFKSYSSALKYAKNYMKKHIED